MTNFEGRLVCVYILLVQPRQTGGMGMEEVGNEKK